MSEEFQKGDIVRLKRGKVHSLDSARMTISNISRTHATYTWFDEIDRNSKHVKMFPLVDLERADDVLD